MIIDNNYGLNNRELLFCKYFLIYYNATKSAELAKYSKKTAGSKGHELLKKVEIQQYLRESIQKTCENLEITEQLILKGLLSEATNYIGTTGASRVQAWVALAKYKKMFTDSATLNVKVDEETTKNVLSELFTEISQRSGRGLPAANLKMIKNG